MHEAGAAVGEAGFLADLRRGGVELGKGMAQVVLLGAGPLEALGGLAPLALEGTPALPRSRLDASAVP